MKKKLLALSALGASPMKKKLLALSALGASPLMFAEDTTTTLPDIGFNISDYLTVAVQGLGTPLKIVFGAAIVLTIGWAAYRWFRRGSKA